MSLRDRIIGDTVGVEIETSLISPNNLSTILENSLGSWFQRTRDASSELFLSGFTGRLATLDTDNILSGMDLNRVTVGTELVSRPMYKAEYEKFVMRLLLELDRLGELPKSQRSAIHIHVGYPQNLSYIKSAILFGMSFESLMYRLGTMGYSFRGKSNQSIYCRPMSTDYGPPIVMCNDGYPRPIAVISDCLEAEYQEAFWKLFGVDVNNLNRYHPSRYYGINVLSVLLHGTIEFRYFNVTLKARDLIAMINLCQSIAETMMKIPMEIYEEIGIHSVFEPQDDFKQFSDLINLLKTYSKSYPVSEENRDILWELLKKSPQVILPKQYIQSHLWDKYCMPEGIYAYGTRDVITSSIPSGFLDSHNLESARIDLTGIINS